MDDKLLGYKLGALISETPEFLYFHGKGEEEERPILVKLCRRDTPTREERDTYRREYEFLLSLQAECVPRPLSLINEKKHLALLLEYFEGISLERFIKTAFPSSILPLKRWEIDRFYHLALGLTEALGVLHRKQIVHKAISPANILVTGRDSQVRLINFEKAIHSVDKPVGKVYSRKLEANLTYLSPEQTGKMNRSVDWRSDLYSLGAVFYEILTGSPPFKGDNAMEMVYSLMAKIPTPPDLIRGEIPSSLSSIVMKLLSKTSEDRYQSAPGLKADLERCWEAFKKGERIDLSLGEKDISQNFRIPEKLYGREKEIEGLMKNFNASCEGAAKMVLVSGYSGVGKTSLINEVHKPIVRKRGYFISGKFDQFKMNIPFNAFILAFQEMVGDLLTESDEMLEAWRKRLIESLGSNGQVIIDVIPEVELIIGPQKPLQNLPPVESQNRFNLVFEKFIRVFSQKGHPLTIFIDDLQWADSGSLKLIETLITSPDSRYLLLVGSYRDNEVDRSHPLMIALDAIERRGATLSHIPLAPLDLPDILLLLKETMGGGEYGPLAQLVKKKTDGNPFFLKQYLKALHEEGGISFDRDGGRWMWNPEAVEASGITDNVVDLMVRKVMKLPSHTRKTLKLAACMGNRFDLKTLSLVNEENLEQTERALEYALKGGLLQPFSGAPEIARRVSSPSDNQTFYRFLHDRVQQAVYSMIPGDERKRVHLEVGRLMVKGLSSQELEENLFDIVDQFNAGLSLITNREEKARLSHLNLRAGKKAKDSTAYEAALRYFTAGKDLLEEECWQEQYSLALSLHEEKAECSYLCTHFEEAERLFDLILSRARSPEEKAKVYNMKIVLYMNNKEPVKAIDLGKEALALFGVSFPQGEEALKKAAGEQIRLLKERLAEKAIEELIALPDMVDEGHKAVMALLMNTIYAAYYVDKSLLALATLKMVEMSLTYGNSDESSFAYVFYGTVLGSRMGDYDQGFQFGELAVEIAERFNNLSLTCTVNFLMAIFVSPWKRSIDHPLRHFQVAYQAGLDSGNFIWAGHSGGHNSINLYVKGEKLEQVLRESDRYLHFLIKNRHPSKDYCILAREAARFWMGEGREGDGEYDGEKHLEEMKFSGQRVGAEWYKILRMQRLYLFGQYGEALESALEVEEKLDVLFGLILVPEFYFYYSLVLSAHYDEVSEEERREILGTLEKHREMMENWADFCPANFEHKFLILKAEGERLQKRYFEAMNLYDEAIESAEENGFTPLAALANELAAKMFLSIGKEDFAGGYMMEARYGYLKWGALKKVHHLEKSHPTLASYSKYEKGTEKSFSNEVEIIDLGAVLRASQAISGEIVLDKLLEKQVEILVENAGAQKGILLLEKEGRWTIEAQAVLEPKRSIIVKPLSLDSLESGENPLLPLSVIRYSERTQESVVINEASRENRFANDPYIRQVRPQSILSLPILYKKETVGILYLENNLISHAFTPGKLESLQILSAQAAISIENARLFANLEKTSEILKCANEKLEVYSTTLEQKVRERTADFQKTLDRLKLANDELRYSQEQLIQAEKMASLGQLVSGVAHEINTPIGISITAASHFAEAVRKISRSYNEGGMNKEDFEAFLQQTESGCELIMKNLLRTSDLIGSFKMVSADQASGEVRRINVESYVQDILMSLKPTLKKTQLNIVVDCPKTLGIKIYPGGLTQVITNFVMNSITHGYENPAKGNIFMKFEVGERELQLTYSDDGKGIKAEHLSKIFDPFFTTSRGKGGTGLGLQIVFNIVHQTWGGRIHCRSEEGKGTVFTIIAPLRKKGSVEKGSGIELVGH